MTALAEKHLAWCEKHYAVKGGTPFTIEGREWVRDEFFRPAFGWRLYPRNHTRACAACQKREGEFVDWSPKLVRSINAHRARVEKCDGLELKPVTFTAQNLMRGDGKTTNAFALISAALADPDMAPLPIQFMASAGSQTETLIEENLLQPIEADRLMRKRFVQKGQKVYFDHGRRGKSYIEFVESSHRSNTGRRRGILFYDECRDIPIRKVMSMLPSIRSTSRFICPRGHGSRDYEPDKVVKCPTCREEMYPFVPRVWMVSTSGLDDGNEQWWNDFVEKRQETPVGSVYLHRSDEPLNPSASAHETDAVEEAFSDVESAQDVLRVEFSNARVRAGDSFTTKQKLRLVADPEIVNLSASRWPCVGFLDTSWSAELTSLVLCGYDPEDGNGYWGRLQMLHWAIWKPKLMAGGLIEPDQIQAHFDEHLPRFPGLVSLLVDDRGRDWAKSFVRFNNQKRGSTFGRRIKGFHVKDAKARRAEDNRYRRRDMRGDDEDRNEAWGELWTRIATTVQGRDQLAIPERAALPELHKELLGVIWEEYRHPRDGSIRYRAKDRNRKKNHADVADSLAMCCLLAFREIEGRRRRPGMDEMRKSTRAKALEDFMRPVTGGIKPKGFF